MGWKEISDGWNVTVDPHDTKTPVEGELIELLVRDSKFGGDKRVAILRDHANDVTIGIWCNSDLERKLSKVAPGSHVRICGNGTMDTGKGNPFKLYRVELFMALDDEEAPEKVPEKVPTEDAKTTVKAKRK